jgi:HlyD family secretion protein
MKRFLKNKFSWALIGVLLIAGVTLLRNTQKSETSNLGVVSRSDLIQRVTISGTVTPNRKTVISAPYNGYIRKLYVQIGGHVNPGDPIVSVAQSLRGSAEDVYPLRSPFSGTVVQILKTEGEYVEQQSTQGGNALVRIDDLSRMFIEAATPEIEIGKIKVGQEAIIKASAVLGRTYQGKIQHISLAAKEQRDWDKSRVEFPVLVAVKDQDELLKSGMSVVLDIITHKLTGILTLRHEFIQKSGDKYFVVTEKGEKKGIEVGIQNEEVFEIRSGVKEGEKIRQTDFLSILKEN